MPTIPATFGGGVVLLLVLWTVAVRAEPWPEPITILSGNTTEFEEVVQVLANATKLSYTSTNCSYYNPADANATLPEGGWDRLPSANPGVGMHAVAFLHAPTGRLLIAFRGTDLDVSRPDAQADVCADAALWSSSSTAILPSFCSDFSERTLAYVPQAIAYVKATVAVALRHLPSSSSIHLMYTGHSLGAGLAAMMAVWPSVDGACPIPPSVGAIVFSAPNYLVALRRHAEGIDLGNGSLASRVVVLADAYDPVHAGAYNEPFHGMIGGLGTWNLTAPSVFCVVCIDVEHARSLATPSCFLCLQQRHIFSHYEQLIWSGQRPKSQGIVNECVGVDTPCTREATDTSGCAL